MVGIREFKEDFMPIPPTPELNRMRAAGTIDAETALMMCVSMRINDNAVYIARVAATTAESGNAIKALTPEFARRVCDNYRTNNAVTYAARLVLVQAEMLALVNAARPRTTYGNQSSNYS